MVYQDDFYIVIEIQVLSLLRNPTLLLGKSYL